MVRQSQFAFSQKNRETHNYIADKVNERLDLAQKIQLLSLVVQINFEKPVPQQICLTVAT